MDAPKAILQNIGAIADFPNIEKATENLSNLLKTGYNTISIGGEVFNVPPMSEIKEFAKRLSDAPLQRLSAHNLHLFPELNSDCNSILPYQEAIFEKAGILGVKNLTCHFGWCKGMRNGDDFNFEDFLKRGGWEFKDYRQKNIEILKILCQNAGKCSLSLSIENLPVGCMCDMNTTVSKLMEIVKEVKEPNLAICLDSGHAFISGLDLRREIFEASNFLFETHFHDNFGKISDGNASNDLHQPAGIGSINWVIVISAMEKINFSNPVVFEIPCDESSLRMNKANWERFLDLHRNKLAGFM